MEYLIVSSIPEVSFFFQVLLQEEGIFQRGLKFTELSQVNNPANNINWQELKLVLINLDDQELNTVAKFIKDYVKAQTLVYFTGNEDSIHLARQAFSYHPQVGHGSYRLPETHLAKQLNNLLSRQERKKNNYAGYFPLESNLFRTLSNLRVDIYIKLSDEKFLKIFKRGDALEEKDIQRFQTREYQYLYFKENDYKEVIKALLASLSASLPVGEKRQRYWLATAKFATRSFLDLALKIGIDDQVLELLEKSFDSVTDLLKENKNLKALLPAFHTSPPNLSNFTLMTIAVALTLARECKLESHLTADKISFAALLCDIGLDDPDLAFVNDKNSREFQLLERDKQNIIVNHPRKCLEKIAEVHGLPIELDALIIQHHELPDGSGFPRGLDWKKIYPLSAIFIMAQDFSNVFCHCPMDQLSFDLYIREARLKYRKGFFLQALDAMIKILGVAPDEQLTTNERASVKKISGDAA